MPWGSIPLEKGVLLGNNASKKGLGDVLRGITILKPLIGPKTLSPLHYRLT